MMDNKFIISIISVLYTLIFKIIFLYTFINFYLYFFIYQVNNIYIMFVLHIMNIFILIKKITIKLNRIILFKIVYLILFYNKIINYVYI